MSAPLSPSLRCILFVPGDRPDRIAKAPRSNPDAVIVDLEDAIGPADKQEARRMALPAVDELVAAEPELPVLVRVNAAGSEWFADDVAAVAASRAAGVVLPVLEQRSDVAQLQDRLRVHGRADAVIVAGLETARGVADARELLAEGLTGVYFGAEDYISDIGGVRTVEGSEVLYARSQVVLAARLAGIVAIDQVMVAIRDDERFLADARQGRAIGFTGKMCLHPRQVELAHEVFSPTETEIAHARAVIAASNSSGVGTVDGEMIDAVHVKMAIAVLERAGVSPEDA